MNTENLTTGSRHELATLGGGCFWCVEAVFEQLRGVSAVESGYCGGGETAPTYEQVCTGRTGHAEVVQITFDPSVISFNDLLDIFFATHDPTTLNRQGNDAGTQYRSAIFYHSNAQREAAERKIAELNQSQVWSNPIVTQVVPFETFFPAEAYHQGYYQANQQVPYCQIVISPKLAKLRRKFAEQLNQ
jgi:peptide-methionine (S)-S-oxide reductase